MHSYGRNYISRGNVLEAKPVIRKYTVASYSINYNIKYFDIAYCF